MKKTIIALLLLPSIALAEWAIPPTLGNPGCTTLDDFVDGHKEAAWVASTFSSYYPLFYLPKEQCGNISQAQVWNSGNTKITDATFLPSHLGGCGKDGRPRYRVPITANALAPHAPLIVRVFLTNGAIECREVLDPAQDYD